MNKSSPFIKEKRNLNLIHESVEIDLNKCCAFENVQKWEIINTTGIKSSKKYLKLTLNKN